MRQNEIVSIRDIATTVNVQVSHGVVFDTLNRAVELMGSSIREDFAYTQLQIFLASDEACICFADYKRSRHAMLEELLLHDADRVELELAFAKLRQWMLEHDNARWNKARLVVDRNNRYCFECCFDLDLEWLRTVDVKDPVYQGLSIEAQQQITSWDGVADKHSRPWIN